MYAFRKYIDKLTTPGRNKAMDYMCDRLNEYFGFNSTMTNDKFFEVTLFSNSTDNWSEWFEYY